MADHFLIEGGHRLAGTFVPAGNKNAALPLIAAALLTDQPVRLRNVPDIEDVRTMLALAQGLGATVTQHGPNEYTLTAKDVRSTEPDRALSRHIRASIVLAGPLLARCGRVRLTRPGGDLIGRRRIDTHLQAFEGLGASIAVEQDAYEFRASRLRGASIFLDQASVTGTENLLMAAALAEGTTTIRNAASEPHVQELCQMLTRMGATVSGIGSNVLVIEGAKRLGGVEHTIGPDHIEVGSMIGLAAVTGSELEIAQARPDDLPMVRIAMARLGLHWEESPRGLRIPGGQPLEVQNDAHGAIPTIDDAPWPGFPADLTSIALVVATQARGTVLIHEKMFESRLYFVDKLISMGARIVLCDPHRAVVIGPSELMGTDLTSPDIRAGMALMIAALGATGTSRIYNVRQIDRGYERIEERLAALGARIERAS